MGPLWGKVRDFINIRSEEACKFVFESSMETCVYSLHFLLQYHESQAKNLNLHLIAIIAENPAGLNEWR